jgi:hypothetical protein
MSLANSWSKPRGRAVSESTAGPATSGVKNAIEASTAITTVPRNVAKARILGDKRMCFILLSSWERGPQWPPVQPQWLMAEISTA